MRRLPVFLSFVGAVTLSGCSAGFNSSNLADVPTQASVGSLRGSVYGGHAPIVGAQIYVLEATATTYGAKAKSLLTASYSDPGYPTTLDSSADATSGLYGVTTDSTGNFDVSGEYTCDVGYPVYLYAAAGAPNSNPDVAITATQGVLAGVLSYTFTFQAKNLLYPGQSVILSGLSGPYAFLNHTSQTVLAAGLDNNQFQIQVATLVTLNLGSASSTGAATPVGVQNPAIVNLAMVGNCPSSGTFTNVISYVYVNEVSTTVTAFAMAPFAIDGLHVGSSSTNLAGLQIAARNANQLYDITGGNQSRVVTDGEAHVARVTTPAGNGTVPQALLDTLGNILANCVDSANAAGATVPQCDLLFGYATSDGTPLGTKPIDIATAAINIAHNPWANVLGIFNLPIEIPPFVPLLTVVPNDFTVALSFTAPGINGPQGIAIDANGAAWITNHFADSGNNYVVKLNADGSAAAGSPFAGVAARTIAIDYGGDAWVTLEGGSAVEELSPSGSVMGSFPSAGDLTQPFGIAIDGSGNVDVSSFSTSNVYQLSNAGVLQNTFTACPNDNTYITLDQAGNMWTDSVSGDNVCEQNGVGTQQFDNLTFTGPNPFAIDASGNAWVPNFGTDVIYRIRPGTGIAKAFGGGGITGPSATAIDGQGNIWVGNRDNSSISELDSSGSPITLLVGYQAGPAESQANIAIDGSGDVWVGYNAFGIDTVTSVTEVIGAAAPVVTPLALATKNSRLGALP